MADNTNITPETTETQATAPETTAEAPKAEGGKTIAKKPAVNTAELQQKAQHYGQEAVTIGKSLFGSLKNLASSVSKKAPAPQAAAPAGEAPQAEAPTAEAPATLQAEAPTADAPTDAE